MLACAYAYAVAEEGRSTGHLRSHHIQWQSFRRSVAGWQCFFPGQRIRSMAGIAAVFAVSEVPRIDVFEVRGWG